MSSLPRALAASAALHAGLIALVARAPGERPPPPKQVEVRLLELVAIEARGGGGDVEPAGGGAEEVDAPRPASTDARPAVAQRTGAADPRASAPKSRLAAAHAPHVPPAGAPGSESNVEPEPALPANALALADTGEHAEEALAERRSDTAAPANDNAIDWAADGSSVVAGHGAPGDGIGSSGGGTGDGSGSGTGTGSGSGTGNGMGDGEAALLDALRWQTARCYPRTAQRRRTEGTVEVRFCVDGSGQPTQIDVARSSGSSLLDDAATDCVVRNSAPFVARGLCITAPIRFRLR